MLAFSSIFVTLSSTRPPASDKDGAGPTSLFLPKTRFMVCLFRSFKPVCRCQVLPGGQYQTLLRIEL